MRMRGCASSTTATIRARDAKRTAVTLHQGPIGQIVSFRSTFAVIPLMIFLLVRREFPGGLATKRPLGHLARSAFGTASMFLSFATIARLPLADSTLVGYVTPLLTALLGGLLLHEA